MRMQTTTRAPMAVPALAVGVLAMLLVLFGPTLFGMIAGVGAAVLGGTAWADTKDSGYKGEGLAIAGVVLGLVALVIGLLAFVVLA
jgi:hypothetical protein